MSETAAELQASAEELFGTCMAALERSLEKWDAAREVSSEEVRNQLLGSRERLLDELGAGITHLEKTLDHLLSTSMAAGEAVEELARARTELEQGLEVARQVERRMGELERELRPDAERPLS